MKATYDKEADAMHIRLINGKVHKTIKVNDSMLVDVDKKGKVLNIEILYVSSQMPRTSIAKTVKSGIPFSIVTA